MINGVIISHITYADLQNTSEIVMEINTNRVVHAVNENEKKYMASTTKILTAITIIENCNLILCVPELPRQIRDFVGSFTGISS